LTSHAFSGLVGLKHASRTHLSSSFLSPHTFSTLHNAHTWLAGSEESSLDGTSPELPQAQKQRVQSL